MIKGLLWIVWTVGASFWLWALYEDNKEVEHESKNKKHK